MGDTIEHTDLSGEAPGPRAIVDQLQEEVEVGFGSRLSLKAKLISGSSLSLALAGSVWAITMSATGAPWWAAACAVPVPTVIYRCFGQRSAK